MKNLVLFIVVFLLFLACKPMKPRGVLSESKMRDVLVDYHLAQGMAESADGDKDENQYIFIQAVFRKYHISEAEFDSSLVYYSIHSEDLAKIYVDVNRRIESKANAMGLQTESKSIYANLTNQGDTANIWNDQKLVVVSPTTLDNIYSFRMEADSTFYLGDSFTWHFNAQFYLQGNNRETFAQLLVRYVNDSVCSHNMTLRSDMEYDLHVEHQSKMDSVPIKEVLGYLYMPIESQDPSVFRMLVVNDIALVRFHKENAIKSIVPVDSLDVDTTEVDTLPLVPERRERLTPLQMRESQPREKTINIVKEKAVNPNLKPMRRRNLNQPRVRR